MDSKGDVRDNDKNELKKPMALHVKNDVVLSDDTNLRDRLLEDPAFAESATKFQQAWTLVGFPATEIWQRLVGACYTSFTDSNHVALTPDKGAVIINRTEWDLCYDMTHAGGSAVTSQKKQFNTWWTATIAPGALSALSIVKPRNSADDVVVRIYKLGCRYGRKPLLYARIRVGMVVDVFDPNETRTPTKTASAGASASDIQVQHEPSELVAQNRHDQTMINVPAESVEGLFDAI